MLWRGVGCGDQNGFAGKGESEVGEHGLESVLGERYETDKKAAGGRGSTRRGRGGEGDIALC
jgi:hypothetical protein